MKKYLVHIILVVVIIILAIVIGCMYFNKQDNTTMSDSVATSESVETSTLESTEALHEHAYTETITTEATCETDGLKTFTCECGDTYTEVIIATGHVFGEYIYNGDATYLADGTDTAKCKNCEVTDTQTAYGTMLKEEVQTESPQDLAAKYLAETLGITVEEAKAMLNNGGNPVSSDNNSSEVAVSNSSSSTAQPTQPHQPPKEGMVYDPSVNMYYDPVTFQYEDGTWNMGAAIEYNDAHAGDGGELTGNVVLNDPSSSGGETMRAPMDGGDGGELVTDGVLNP